MFSALLFVHYMRADCRHSVSLWSVVQTKQRMITSPPLPTSSIDLISSAHDLERRLHIPIQVQCHRLKWLKGFAVLDFFCDPSLCNCDRPLVQVVAKVSPFAQSDHGAA